MSDRNITVGCWVRAVRIVNPPTHDGYVDFDVDGEVISIGKTGKMLVRTEGNNDIVCYVIGAFVIPRPDPQPE